MSSDLVGHKDGEGGGNRTRVRMVSSQRVYVRSLRSISARRVTETRDVGPRQTWFSSPVAVCQRPGTSLLMTPATR